MPHAPVFGETVMVHRNMDHPAHREYRRNAYDELVGKPKPGLEPDLGDMAVTETWHQPQVLSPRQWGHRPEKNLVRLSNGFWYDCATGMQDGSEATYFTIKNAH